MSMHVVAYSLLAHPAALTQVPATNDIVLQIRDNAIVCNKVNRLGAVWGIAATLNRIQMQAPSFRKVAQLEIQPVMRLMPVAGTAPSGWFRDFDRGPHLEMDDGEELAAWCTDGAGSNEQINVFARLWEQAPQPVSGKIFSVRVTSATTVVANTWSNCALTFDQNLPRGKFQLVGMRMNSTSAQAFRVFFINQTFRPGGVAQQSDYALDEPSQRYGRLGVWGEFDYLSPPTVDMFCTAADAAQEGIADLIYLG